MKVAIPFFFFFFWGGGGGGREGMSGSQNLNGGSSTSFK